MQAARLQVVQAELAQRDRELEKLRLENLRLLAARDGALTQVTSCEERRAQDGLRLEELGDSHRQLLLTNEDLSSRAEELAAQVQVLEEERDVARASE